MLSFLSLVLIMLNTGIQEQNLAMFDQHNDAVKKAIANSLGDFASNAEVQVVKANKEPILLDGKSVHFTHFREFPMQLVPPKPFTSRNISMVSTSGGIETFHDRKSFHKTYIKSSPKLTEKLIPSFASSFLVASSMFSQDGFFEFIDDPKLQSVQVLDDVIITTNTRPVVEKSGDKGELKLKMTFVATETAGQYVLSQIEEKETIQPGIRPVCQCTLLLDKNPIVRRMAERDLLVMGRSAFPYMKMQLDLASPELKKEIERVWKRIENGER